MRKRDVRGQPAAEERADASPGPIEELIRNHDVGGFVLLLEAADGAGGEDVLHAEQLHPEDVGAEVQLRRQQPVAGAVPRQKRDAPSAQRADDVRTRRFTKRRRQRHLFAIGDGGHVVQAAATDDSDLNVVHGFLVYNT